MLTVLLATRNGVDTLSRMLARLADAAPPPGGWKLVLVDNASTDGTDVRAQSWAKRLPLDYVSEPRAGKSFALNTGLARVEGDLVVFADDDILVAPDWLVGWRRAADENPEFALFGGAIVPHFDSPPPGWIPSGWHSYLYTATQTRPAGAMDPQFVFGPNMAVRRLALTPDVRFDVRLGPIGAVAGVGDETGFCLELASRGHRAYFVPWVEVGHIVQPYQFKASWVLTRWYRHGRKEIALDRCFGRASFEDVPMMFGAPRWFLRRFLTALLTVPVAAASLDRGKLMARLAHVYFCWGQIREARAAAPTSASPLAHSRLPER